MGAVLNWRMPIEWDDGTAAQLDVVSVNRLSAGEDPSVFFVVSEHEPRGWNRRTMPKLGKLNPVMVNPDGTLDCDAGPTAPRLRNIELPLLKFEDGSEPKRISIVDDATRLVLLHENGRTYSYHWPRLIPRKPGAPKLIEVTPAMVAAEEKAEAEQAEMEDNPWFGAF